MTDTAQLREALVGTDDEFWYPNEQIIVDAARELLTIKEAGALIITPDENGRGWPIPREALLAARREVRAVGHEDGLRQVLNVFLDALRDAMPDGET